VANATVALSLRGCRREPPPEGGGSIGGAVPRSGGRGRVFGRDINSRGTWV